MLRQPSRAESFAVRRPLRSLVTVIDRLPAASALDTRLRPIAAVTTLRSETRKTSFTLPTPGRALSFVTRGGTASGAPTWMVAVISGWIVHSRAKRPGYLNLWAFAAGAVGPES